MAPLVLLRVLFLILSMLLMTLYMTSSPEPLALTHVAIGLGFGALLFGLFLSSEALLKRIQLRSFNALIIGLFIGLLFGKAITSIFETFLEISALSSAFSTGTLSLIKASFFLWGAYTGTRLTYKASENFCLEIPFIKFLVSSEKKRLFVIDPSALYDSRIVDLCTTGLFDHCLVIPGFITKELHALAEVGDDLIKQKAKKALETLKKLESTPGIEITFHPSDFPDLKESSEKTIRLATLLQASILTSEISKVQTADKIKIININALSTALKPVMQAGESIKIRVQRIGKEPKQGVGYLDDGTMVVINGGGSYLSQTVGAKVLSVKHTVSGRMIFCNLLDEDPLLETAEEEYARI